MYATKEACREMAKPRQKSWGQVKRLARYLVKRPRAVQVFRHQELPHCLSVYCDSDWAACKRTRKSTSGGSLWMGSHVLKTWASTLSVIAISVGEAEYYAIVNGASQALGLQSLLQEMGFKTGVKIRTDSA